MNCIVHLTNLHMELIYQRGCRKILRYSLNFESIKITVTNHNLRDDIMNVLWDTVNVSLRNHLSFSMP